MTSMFFLTQIYKRREGNARLRIMIEEKEKKIYHFPNFLSKYNKEKKRKRKSQASFEPKMKTD